jgi:hypothetical protein
MTILHIVLLAALAQNAVPQSAVAVRGVVVRAGSGDPLTKVTVELRGEEMTAIPLRAAAGDDGRFVFVNVSPGRYRLLATRPGYVRSPQTVTVVAGQQVELRLPMTPGGAIFGRVYDDKGQPVGGAEVRALKASYQDGRRTLTEVQSVDTNDLGEYRLFWLQPGRYYISALGQEPNAFRGSGMIGGTGTMGGAGRPGALYLYRGTADPERTAFAPIPSEPPQYVPVYFPGTVDERAASAIDLRPGAEFGEVNLVVAPAAERRVRGTVIDGATGLPARFAGLRRSTDVGRGIPSAKPFEDVDPETGAFEVNLLPGAHTLMATAGKGVGYAMLQVGDADIDNVRIVTSSTFSLAARVVVEGRAGDNPDLRSLRISLRRDPPLPGTSSSSYSNPLPDGSFALEAGIGNFRVNVAPILNLPATLPSFVRVAPSLERAYVKSIRLGSADILNDGLRLTRPVENRLEIVVGTDPGELEGIVAGQSRQPVADASVVLLPEIRSRIDLYRSTLADASGRFRFDRIPPGDYRIFAWAEVENDAWFDADFMSVYESRGTPIRIGEGTAGAVRVGLID